MRTTGAFHVERKKQQPYQDIFLNKKIVAPEKLKILVLSGNDLVNDELQFVQKCGNLIKLDVSNNYISSISGKLRMSSLKKLKILHLHKNKISKLDGMQGVFNIPQLVHLTIRDNPIERLPRIEHLIINMLPSLKILGERVIFLQQRSPEMIWQRNNVLIDSDFIEGWKTKQNQEIQYIKILQMQLKYFDNIWAFNNPIVFIQRKWRQLMKQRKKAKIHGKATTKKQLQDQDFEIREQDNSFLKSYFYQWCLYTQNRKTIKKMLQQTSSYPHNKQYLTYQLDEYQIQLRNFKLNETLLNYVDKIRKKIFYRKMAEKLRRNLKKRSLEFNGPECFINITHTKCIYFSRSQRHLLDHFLYNIGENFNWRQKIHESVKIAPLKNYLTIRCVDPQAFAYKPVYSTLTYLLWPSMRAIFLKKKKYQIKQKSSFIQIRTLNYIKNRDQFLTSKQKQKSIKVYKQLSKFISKEYQNSVDCFQCHNEDVFKMLIRYIFYHNTKTKNFKTRPNHNQMASLLESYDEPFLFYIDTVIERTAAAVRIQQNWRKYINNCKQAQSIYAKMKRTRAALKIQRFLRDRVFCHRLRFQKNLANELKLYNSGSFYLHRSIYQKIFQLTNQDSKLALYHGIDLYQQVLNSGKKRFTMKWEMNKNPFPPHIRSLIGQERTENIQSERQIDMLCLLHTGATVSILQYGGNTFYEFQYQNIHEARLRLSIIALFTYRVWGSRFILPLSKQTLQLAQSRLVQYQNYANLSDVTPISMSPDRIKKMSPLQISGLFLSNKKEYLPKSKNSISLEFYQKQYQDFPQKYNAMIFYQIPFFILNKIEEQKQKAMKELFSGNILRAQEDHEEANYHEKNKRSETAQISVSKIDKKRLSLYDFGYNTEAQAKDKKMERKNRETAEIKMYEASYLEMTNKKHNIARARVEEQNKKSEIKEKKKSELVRIREKLKNEKILNNSIKNMKDMERSETLKKKVEKVKEFKSRVLSQKKQEDSEDFIQQGNFVMEQQLKMVILCSKMKNNQQKKKQRVNTRDSGLENKRKTSYSFSIHSGKKEDLQLSRMQNTMNNPSIKQMESRQDINVIGEGEEKKILNIKPPRKSRTNSIGAYLRDPSYVHGVFPQEYYPMETKGAFKFFPPL